jgi:hypothetical protein
MDQKQKEGRTPRIFEHKPKNMQPKTDQISNKQGHDFIPKHA